MAEIKFEDEYDLQRKIVKILNKQGFHFEKAKASYFCDLVDKINKIYVEVKPEGFAPAQILYGLAKSNTQDAKFIALACNYEIRFYTPPIFSLILEFAKSIDPSLKRATSQINKQEYNERAFQLLGNHQIIYTYSDTLDIAISKKEIFINKDNYTYFKSIFAKYKINPMQFITFIADIYAKNNSIVINNDGKILETKSGKFFRNSDSKQETLIIDHLPIKDFRDKELLEWTRVKNEDVQEILHQIDRLEPVSSRRKRGRYFTKMEISDDVAEIVKRTINPTFIIEPYCGAGSLIDGLVNSVNGVANDINEGFINTLVKKYDGFNWNFTNLNTITTTIEDLNKKWNIPENTDRLLILTNPPFGTTSTNVLASKKDEVKSGKSRKITIEYGGLDKEYGKGDLVIPAVAKLIEFIKRRGNGYLAFFSPAGVFCGRQRYNKLFKAILKDFEYIEGYVFSGDKFNGTAKKKAISFTLWKYSKNVNTSYESLFFFFNDEVIKLKALPLLKDGWKYDTRKIVRNEIVVQGNDRFNASPPKIFHSKVAKGGSELVYENIKIDLNIPNVPSELAYGLWSATVGYLSITNFPIYINEAYTHLPDFSRKETMEILAYVVIHTLISELTNNYTDGRIGFSGMARLFKFGGMRLTDGVKYLIDTYGSCKIGGTTITKVFEELKNQPDITKISKDYRSLIKKEIEDRLEKIEYWKYIPI